MLWEDDLMLILWEDESDLTVCRIFSEIHCNKNYLQLFSHLCKQRNEEHCKHNFHRNTSIPLGSGEGNPRKLIVYRQVLPQGPDPYLFISVLTVKVTLSYTFHGKWFPYYPLYLQKKIILYLLNFEQQLLKILKKKNQQFSGSIQDILEDPQENLNDSFYYPFVYIQPEK